MKTEFPIPAVFQSKAECSLLRVSKMAPVYQFYCVLHRLKTNTHLALSYREHDLICSQSVCLDISIWQLLFFELLHFTALCDSLFCPISSKPKKNTKTDTQAMQSCTSLRSIYLEHASQTQTHWLIFFSPQFLPKLPCFFNGQVKRLLSVSFQSKKNYSEFLYSYCLSMPFGKNLLNLWKCSSLVSIANTFGYLKHKIQQTEKSYEKNVLSSNLIKKESKLTFRFTNPLTETVCSFPHKESHLFVSLTAFIS